MQMMASDMAAQVADDITTDVQQSILALDKLIKITEEKYSYIYETLPLVEQDMALSCRELEIMLAHLIYKNPAAGGEPSLIRATLDQVLGQMQDVTESFMDECLIQTMEDIFLQDASGKSSSFAELDKVVFDVEVFIDVLRDLALNSIIYSVKLGNAGSAFQVLSDRINQVSLELRHRFDLMKPAIEKLNQWNEDFTSRLQSYIDYQVQFKTDQMQKVQLQTREVDETLGTVGQMLEDNLRQVQVVFSKVGQMMVMIQNQDIIRQNIENLMKCLHIVTEKKNLTIEGQQEHLLDYVVFVERVLELAQGLVANVDEGLDESLGGLQQVLAAMTEDSRVIETDLSQITQGFVPGNAADNPLEVAFGLVQDQVQNLGQARDWIMAESGVLRARRQEFVDLMTIVDNNLEEINHQARTLKKMRILIKIELARVDLNSSFTVESIVDAIDQVIQSINVNQQAFRKLSDYFLKNLASFDRCLGLSTQRLQSADLVMEDLNYRLETLHSLTSGAIAAMETEMLSMFTQLQRVTEKLQENEDRCQLTLEVKSRISSALSHTQMLRGRLFDQYEVSHWEEKEEALREVMQQFTCFVERQALTSLTGQLEEDIGSVDGDIVLF